MDNKEEKNEKKPSWFKRRKPWQKIVIVAGAIILLLILFITLAVNLILGKMGKLGDDDGVSPEDEYFETDDNPSNHPVVDPNSIDWPDNIGKLGDGNITNILLIGEDEKSGGASRSDSMMILSINNDSNKVSVVSLMRDLYVQIPGYTDNRLNASYAFGGVELLNKTILQNFGIPIDGNIKVDFEAFTSVVDIVGGVDVSLSEPECKYLGRAGYNNLKPGINHLNGQLALEFSRIRYLDGADFARTERQRKVISAVFNKARSADYETLIKMVNTLLPVISTDMTKMQILFLAEKYAAKLPSLRVNMYRIPGDGDYYYASIRGMSVLVPDLEGCRADLKEFIYG